MTKKLKKPDIATHDEILEILTGQARKGSVTAAAALERALRAREREESLKDEFDKIVQRK